MVVASVVFKDTSLIRRFERVQRGRKHPKVTRTIRDLAIERLQQIETSGDPASAHSKLPITGTVEGAGANVVTK